MSILYPSYLLNLTQAICNRSQAICISPRAMGFGWTLFFDWKGQFFPLLYSWCGAFDSNTHIITYKLKAACIQTGLKLTRNTKVILNMSCWNYSIQGEEEPRRRVPQCSLPKLRVDNPLDPSLTLDPLSLHVRGKEPQMIVTHAFIQHAKPMLMYTDDARTASSNIECHHGLRVWEQLVGDGWRETGYNS